jgi:hypothetical protein
MAPARGVMTRQLRLLLLAWQLSSWLLLLSCIGMVVVDLLLLLLLGHGAAHLHSHNQK